MWDYKKDLKFMSIESQQRRGGAEKVPYLKEKCQKIWQKKQTYNLRSCSKSWNNG